MTLWEVDIYPLPGHADVQAKTIAADAADLGIALSHPATAPTATMATTATMASGGRQPPESAPIQVAHGYLIQGQLNRQQIDRLAQQLLSDDVVERIIVGQATDLELSAPPVGLPLLVHVLPKPGVMDPVADSAQAAIADYGVPAQAVRTLRKFWLPQISDDDLQRLCTKILANDAIEQVIVGPLPFDRIELGSAYEFQLVTVPLREMNDEQLQRLSRQAQLYLTLVEMQTIGHHFRDLGRDPTDVELETLAQTWSEHCSHKTLAGRIAYRDEQGERHFENMLKETIFAATQKIRQQLGDDDWCVSVFKDNAGIVRFDDDYNVCFKVETHNHPSALEPYGGANTGIGGVIRDPLGTGMGAKPICNTDVFCFAPPDTPADLLPPGVLHPRRVMKGVVAGVRDYGNRMGIPTVNGAIYFDERYLGNPLVYCGNVGLIPRDMSDKQPQPGDYIVAIGGRTGRDGIHGATFSSAELTHESETLSGGAVQIGNAVAEKKVVDVVLAARDWQDGPLYSAITDCGAGGFSSAVGEMGEEIGADVWLEKAPLKYEGLSYTEIWISEAQERMVLSVPPEKWETFQRLCESEAVEATVIGKFDPERKGRLRLFYHGQQVADLSMQFLHEGRPPVVREAVYLPLPLGEGRGEGKQLSRPLRESQNKQLSLPLGEGYNDTLLKILSSLNVCSKEWVIRQYDHEVQGGSVIKPLVGVANDGPSDAAVVRPLLSSYRGLAISCGMNPHYGDIDPYHMAASAIDEAVRNCVAVGADPSRIAILDNFCWGYTDRAETLGTLVRAALACHDVAVALGTPFISGKDSLNNEFSYIDPVTGEKRTIAIPPTLLISAMGQVNDVRKCVTMDLKESGNRLYLVGGTKDELGGSHFNLVHGLSGGNVPTVDPENAKRTFAALHKSIEAGLVRSCHDLSEGGLAVAAAEMAFAGGLGALVFLDGVPHRLDGNVDHLATRLLFSESNSRFLCEVRRGDAHDFESIFAEIEAGFIGEVIEEPLKLVFAFNVKHTVFRSSLVDLKETWQSPLRW